VLSVGLAVGVASGWVGHSLLGPAAAPAGPAVAVAQGGEPAPAEAPPPEPTPPAPPEKPPRPETPTASAPAPKAPAPPPAGERILDEAKPIAPADFERLRALIKPRPGEASWDEIPWMTNLWEARKKAAAEGKPLFVWSASADPLGCS
jgi:hypothetical protein